MFAKLSVLLVALLLIFASTYLVAEEHSGQGGLLDLKPGLSIWTIITFLVLLAVLTKFAWKPMLKSLDEREQHIHNQISNAELSRQQADQLLDETKQKLSSANNEARTIVDSASQRANQIRQQAVIQTERECANIKINSQKQISSMQTKAVEEMLGNTSDLSIEIASQIIQKALTPEDHSRLIADSIANTRRKLKIS